MVYWIRSGVNLRDTDPRLVARFKAAAADPSTPKDLTVVSATRTYASQALLRKQYLDGVGPMAADPDVWLRGYHGSAHMIQLDGVSHALDIHTSDQATWHEIAAKHGLCWPVPGEDWHTELDPTWEDDDMTIDELAAALGARVQPTLDGRKVLLWDFPLPDGTTASVDLRDMLVKLTAPR